MQHERFLRAFIWGASAALLAGCGGRSLEPVSTKPEAQSSSPAAIASPEAPLVIANWDETERLIAAERGKVVVLDLWATW